MWQVQRSGEAVYNASPSFIITIYSTSLDPLPSYIHWSMWLRIIEKPEAARVSKCDDESSHGVRVPVRFNGRAVEDALTDSSLPLVVASPSPSSATVQGIEGNWGNVSEVRAKTAKPVYERCSVCCFLTPTHSKIKRREEKIFLVPVVLSGRDYLSHSSCRLTCGCVRQMWHQNHFHFLCSTPFRALWCHPASLSFTPHCLFVTLNVYLTYWLVFIWLYFMLCDFNCDSSLCFFVWVCSYICAGITSTLFKRGLRTIFNNQHLFTAAYMCEGVFVCGYLLTLYMSGSLALNHSKPTETGLFELLFAKPLII